MDPHRQRSELLRELKNLEEKLHPLEQISERNVDQEQELRALIRSRDEIAVELVSSITQDESAIQAITGQRRKDTETEEKQASTSAAAQEPQASTSAAATLGPRESNTPNMGDPGIQTIPDLMRNIANLKIEGAANGNTLTPEHIEQRRMNYKSTNFPSFKGSKEGKTPDEVSLALQIFLYKALSVAMNEGLNDQETVSMIILKLEGDAASVVLSDPDATMSTAYLVNALKARFALNFRSKDLAMSELHFMRQHHHEALETFADRLRRKAVQVIPGQDIPSMELREQTMKNLFIKGLTSRRLQENLLIQPPDQLTTLANLLDTALRLQTNEQLISGSRVLTVRGRNEGEYGNQVRRYQPPNSRYSREPMMPNGARTRRFPHRVYNVRGNFQRIRGGQHQYSPPSRVNIPRCFRCQQPGHFMNNCPQRRQNFNQVHRGHGGRFAGRRNPDLRPQGFERREFQAGNRDHQHTTESEDEILEIAARTILDNSSARSHPKN